MPCLRRAAPVVLRAGATRKDCLETKHGPERAEILSGELGEADALRRKVMVHPQPLGDGVVEAQSGELCITVPP